MAYIKTTWVNTTSPAINAANLNKLEQGVENAHTGFEAAQSTANAAQSTANTAIATANAAGANANAAVVTANNASALATAVNNEVVGARGAQANLDARLDIYDGVKSELDGQKIALDQFAATALISLYPEGYSRMRVTAGNGWPDNVAGTVTTHRTANFGSQEIQSVDNAVYRRTSIVVLGNPQWNAFVKQAKFSDIEGMNGGPNISDQKLLEWFDEFYQKIRLGVPIGTPQTYNPTYPDIVQTANIFWPDGVFGIYTLGSLDNYWEAETSWTITHTTSGKTVTQPTITIDANGIETKPTPTIS